MRGFSHSSATNSSPVTTLEHARAYVAAGLSVLPIKPDGSKAPALNKGEPAIYRDQRFPTDAELVGWFGDGTKGVAVTCGALSGNLAVLDFESAGAWDQWEAAIPGETRDFLEACPLVRTPWGGAHVWVRLPTAVPSGKLAEFAEKVNDKDTKSEIKGQGGYVLAPGCPGACHVTGKTYRLERTGWLDDNQTPPMVFDNETGWWPVLRDIVRRNGPQTAEAIHERFGYPLDGVRAGLSQYVSEGLLTETSGVFAIPVDEQPAPPKRQRWTLPDAVWLEWCELAEAFTEVAPETTTPHDRVVSDDEPGTDFNRRASWEDTGLFAAGWAWESRDGEGGTVRRPGKARGVSGTLGRVKSTANGWPLFHCFTSGGRPFEQGHSYDKFGVYARLNHGGDFKAAARALGEKGWGKRSAGTKPTIGDAAGAPPETPGAKPRWPMPVPVSQLPEHGPAADWLANGLIAKGHITLFSALMKAGKTTFMSHLLRALQVGGKFVGRDVRRCRTLFVSEESAAIWRGRRDELALSDNLSLLCRPMSTKPSPAEWLDFVGHVRTCAKGFDLVAIDTIGTFAPWENENDAPQVTAAMLPLNTILEDNTGVLLFHHNNKAGGEEGRGIRGSTALPAACDVILELRRFKPNVPADRRRVITGSGRFDEIPAEMVVALAEDCSGYTATGDRKAEAARELEEAIMGIVRDATGAGWTTDEIHKKLPADDRPQRSRVKAVLEAGVGKGLWRADGAGKRGSPTRFQRNTLDCGLVV